MANPYDHMNMFKEFSLGQDLKKLKKDLAQKYESLVKKEMDAKEFFENIYNEGIDLSSNDNALIKICEEESGGEDAFFRTEIEDEKEYIIEKIKRDERVIARSFMLGQNYHNDEQVRILKKTQPHLFV